MVVKQIRLKNTTEKIFSCVDCPWYCFEGYYCNNIKSSLVYDANIPWGCPLEDYTDTNTDLGFV
jgi:hypothetical protein